MQTLDYKVSQLFIYDLDTDNFDSDPTKNGTTLNWLPKENIYEILLMMM